MVLSTRTDGAYDRLVETQAAESLLDVDYALATSAAQSENATD